MRKKEGSLASLKDFVSQLIRFGALEGDLRFEGIGEKEACGSGFSTYNDHFEFYECALGIVTLLGILGNIGNKSYCEIWWDFWAIDLSRKKNVWVLLSPSVQQ